MLDCHARIRHFTSLARTLAHVEQASSDQVADAARSVTRYFAQALPLHVADEEQSIVPRLRGLDPALDAALAAMAAEHREHEQPLSELLRLMALLSAHPDELAQHADALAAVSAELAGLIEPHLEAEERVIIPALSRLSDEVLTAIRSEMRARRA
jgi:hemerythrin-like domain-containing protein